jgi:hypothetical protein
MLIVSGAFITFFSKLIAEAILSNKREVNEADIVYIKLIGFACILAAAIMILI